MFGADFFLIGGFLSLVSAPVVQCTLPKAPRIEVVPKTAPTAHDYSKSLEHLSDIKSNTVSPYGGHAEQIVFGLHEGTMQIAYETSMGATVWDELGLACLYYDKVRITLELNPVIYVARELKPGSCPHKAVLAHEKKHVQADRVIANKYAQEIGLAVQEAVDGFGALGPFPAAEMEQRQKALAEQVHEVVSGLKLSMVEEQLAAQQAIDSLEEYESISRQISDVCRYKVPDSVRETIRRIDARKDLNP